MHDRLGEIGDEMRNRQRESGSRRSERARRWRERARPHAHSSRSIDGAEPSGELSGESVPAKERHRGRRSSRSAAMIARQSMRRG